MTPSTPSNELSQTLSFPASAEHERLVAEFLAAADPARVAEVEAKYVVLAEDAAGRIREAGHRREISAFSPTDEADEVPRGNLTPAERQSVSETYRAAELVAAGVAFRPDVYLTEEALRRRESRKPLHDEKKQGRKALHNERKQGR